MNRRASVHAHSPETSQAPPHERRRHPRAPASGAVKLVFHDPLPVVVRGWLLDVSLGGFRAAHHSILETGREVFFEFAARTGKARVVWNRVVGGRVESGFFIIG